MILVKLRKFSDLGLSEKLLAFNKEKMQGSMQKTLWIKN